MEKKIRRCVTVLAWVLAGLCIAASAQAQSFFIVNTSGCIQYIGVRNSNGGTCVNKNLMSNADASLTNARGTGISFITAGPTQSIEACCYRPKVNASVDLSGENWRIDIEPSGIRVTNRETYAVVFSAPGEFSKCVSAETTGAMGGIMPSGQPLVPKGQ